MRQRWSGLEGYFAVIVAQKVPILICREVVRGVRDATCRT